MPGGFYFAVRATLSLSGSAAGKGVVNPKNDDGSNDRYELPLDVDAMNPLRTEHGKQIAAHNRPLDAENNIQDQAFTLFVHDFTGDKTRDQSQHNPTNNRHFNLRWLSASNFNP